MRKFIQPNEKIFIAGANGMVGKAAKKSLLKFGYGIEENGGALLTPLRNDLDLLNYEKVKNIFYN